MLELLRDVFGYLREQRKLWMVPLILVLMLLGTLLALSQSVLAPFIYVLF
jgi:uncharacterized protein DUF5989